MTTEAESRAAAWLQAWDASGVHRTGTEADAAGAAWLAREAASLGAGATVEEFALDRIDPVAAYLELDGVRIDGVPVFDSVGHINTRELGDGLARALGNRRALLIKMHGAAIVGPTLEEAFVAAFQLEENAQQQLLAEQTGAKIEPMTSDDVARCMKQSWRPESIQKRWQFYLDKQSLKA